MPMPEHHPLVDEAVVELDVGRWGAYDSFAPLGRVGVQPDELHPHCTPEGLPTQAESA